MTALFGTLVPLAIVVALSPLSVVPALLMVLHAPRPRPSGLTYLFGWLVGLGSVTTIFVQAPLLVGHHSTPRWVPWLSITGGAVLFLVGVSHWATRRHSDDSSPRLRTLASKITPVTAGAIGIALAVVNPKVLFITAAAGVAIGTAGFNTLASAGAIAGYAALAGSTVAIPILAYAVAAERIDPQLERARAWIDKHRSALTLVIVVIVSGVLICSGMRSV